MKRNKRKWQKIDVVGGNGEILTRDVIDPVDIACAVPTIAR
jgi:hypothetical protein